MSDQTRFKIEIYCEGVVLSTPVRGKRQYLLHKAFLDELTGHPYPAHPIPHPDGDLYMLSREQIAAYSAFRRELRGIVSRMPLRKAQARLDRGARSAVPGEFESFCFSLAMGIKYAGSTPKKAVRYAISTLSREESEAALRFLSRIADGNYDVQDLQRLWDRCACELGLTTGGDSRAFFLTIRSEVAKLVKPTIARRHSRR